MCWAVSKQANTSLPTYLFLFFYMYLLCMRTDTFTRYVPVASLCYTERGSGGAITTCLGVGQLHCRSLVFACIRVVHIHKKGQIMAYYQISNFGYDFSIYRH